MQRKVYLGCAAVALAAGLGVTACGGSTTGSGAAATAPATPPATTATAAPTSSPSESIAGLPFYQPSHVESHVGNSAVLTSPDSVSKVSDYYVKVVQEHGWTTVAKSLTPYNGNLTIKKAGQGANIEISPSGSGSRISISSYPTG